MSERISRHRELLALCSLRVDEDRCDWGVIARHMQRELSIDGILEGTPLEAGTRAHRTGWVASTASDAQWKLAYEHADAELDAAEQVGARMVSIADDAYPINLRFIHNLPPFLFYRGELDPAGDANSVAVVGTRAASERGLEKASKMASKLVELGVTVTSGLAKGIDAAAHRSALEMKGRTIAVVGTGITRTYPAENKDLAESIVESGGVLVSQFFPSATPAPWMFRKRNEVTSGISQGTVVIEASSTSGAKMQARLASEHGKRVFLIKSLVDAQDWARNMIESGDAIPVEWVDEIARRLASPDRLKAASDQLYLEPLAVLSRQVGDSG